MAQNLEDRDCRPASDTKQYWAVMTFYERFEHLVALVLSAVISVIILDGVVVGINTAIVSHSGGEREPAQQAPVTADVQGRHTPLCLFELVSAEELLIDSPP